MIFLYFIIIGAISGSTEGIGVLPDGPLNGSVGGTVMFTTSLNPTETPFLAVSWEFVGNPASKPIITSLLDANITAPEYDGRITIFRSTGSLQLRNLMLSDSGKYRVTIQPAEGLSKMGETTLEMYEPVSDVRVLPLSTDLIEFKNSVHLSCLSSGTSLSFVWMNSSTEFTPSDRVQITNEGSTLTIINVTRYEEGPYTCFVFNPASSNISDPINVFVSYGPDNVQTKVYPSKQHHQQGSDISLICLTESQPPPDVLWFLDGKQLPSSDQFLQFINIQMSQSGNYSCEALNSKTGRSQKSIPFPIFVHEPVFNVKVTQENAHLIEYNDSVSFFCSSSGSSLSFLWKKGSSQVTANNRVQITDGGSTLTIVNVTRYDEGSYSCHVFNPVSNASSDPAYLSVSYGPENVTLRVDPASQKHYEEGSDISLSCSADSRPPATFYWLLNGNFLPDSGSELKFINAQRNQSGNYSCQAFNSRTSVYQTSQLSIISIVDAGGLSNGAIAGIVLACLISAVLGTAGGFFLHKKITHSEPEQIYDKDLPQL